MFFTNLHHCRPLPSKKSKPKAPRRSAQVDDSEDSELDDVVEGTRHFITSFPVASAVPAPPSSIPRTINTDEQVRACAATGAAGCPRERRVYGEHTRVSHCDVCTDSLPG